MLLIAAALSAAGSGDAGEAERIMGAAIARGVAEDLWERMDLVISTKIFFGGRGQRDTLNSAQNISRKKLYEGLRASLARLDLEYVDVVFCHRPDPTTPIEETVRASLFDTPRTGPLPDFHRIAVRCAA